MISYTTFSLGYFYLSPLFFIFYNVAQNNRFNFISNYGRATSQQREKNRMWKMSF